MAASASSSSSEIPAMGYGTWKIARSVASIAVYEAIKFAGVSSFYSFLIMIARLRITF